MGRPDVERSRVTELYVPASSRPGGGIGSGYRTGPATVVTAAHVVADLPTWPADPPLPAVLDGPGSCRVRPLDATDWVPAVVAWRDAEADVAVLRVDPEHPALTPLDGSMPVRWVA